MKEEKQHRELLSRTIQVKKRGQSLSFGGSATSSIPVQRKVNIAKKPLEESETFSERVKALIMDDRFRSFETLQEFDQYMHRETRKIGWVETANTWIRLPEDKRVVLGEEHNATTTFPDIVRAVYEPNFLYELYNDIPDEFPKAMAYNQQKISKLEQQTEQKGGDHHLDAFYPKMVEALSLLKEVPALDNPGFYLNKTLAFYLGLILNFVKDLYFKHPKEKELKNVFIVWRTFSDDIYGLIEKVNEKPECINKEVSFKGYSEQIGNLSVELLNYFQQKNFFEDPKEEIRICQSKDKLTVISMWRDKYMLKRILETNAALIGMGEKHMKRLSSLFSKGEDRGLIFMKLEDLLTKKGE